MFFEFLVHINPGLGYNPDTELSFKEVMAERAYVRWRLQSLRAVNH